MKRGQIIWWSVGVFGSGWIARQLQLPHPEGTRYRNNCKRGAMYVLARLGPLGKDALPALRRVGQDSDFFNDVFAFSAIAGIGPEPKDIPLLIKALADKNSMLRFQAARGLGNLGFRSEEAVVALTSAIHDENQSVREQVSAA